MLLTSTGSGNSIIEFITVLLIFVFVLVVTFFVTKWIGQYQKTQTVGDNIEVLETARISPSVCVEIIKLGKRYIAVAVAKESVTMLCELEADDIDIRPVSQQASVDFASILSKVKGGAIRDDQIFNEEDKHEE